MKIRIDGQQHDVDPADLRFEPVGNDHHRIVFGTAGSIIVTHDELIRMTEEFKDMARTHRLGKVRIIGTNEH